MLYIKLFIEREKNIGQSAPECPFNLMINLNLLLLCSTSTNAYVDALVLANVLVYRMWCAFALVPLQTSSTEHDAPAPV